MNSSGDRPRDLAREYGLSPQERAEVERLRGLRSQTSASRPQPSSSGAHGASKSGAANGTGSSRGRADAAQPVWLAAADLERLRKDGGTTEFAQNGSTWRVNEFFQANTLTDMAQSVLGELHRAQEATAASLRRASAAARVCGRYTGRVTVSVCANPCSYLVSSMSLLGGMHRNVR